MIDFSLILATRERHTLLKNLLRSITATTAVPERTEVVVVMDDDDLNSVGYIPRYQELCPRARFIVKPRSRNLNEDYLNWAYREHTSGSSLIVLNDDAEFETHNWDDVIRSKLAQYMKDKPDGIAYGWIEDRLKQRHGMSYCCFPLVTRKAADHLGFVMPAQFKAWGADIALWRIFHKIERVCDLSEVTIDHISPHNKSREKDDINKYVEKLSQGSCDPAGWRFPADHYSGILQNVIDTYQ